MCHICYTYRNCYYFIVSVLYSPWQKLIMIFFSYRIWNKFNISCKCMSIIYPYYFVVRHGSYTQPQRGPHQPIECPWWMNSLWPSDAIWRHRSRSTLSQIMTCCLTAPSHYLNCWLLISEVLWQSSEYNFTGNAQDIFGMSLKITNFIFPPYLPVPNE